ncbi:polygalacturonase inhibitor 2-like [Trifolium pratense]|uniref:polygalacturonase inhibitor 2-like n=1 Tax=Trifolium pratense TaxID=57577 RepID=UPI001E68FE63|nr:polygalacturonase inhibitor 2-like [Trifolium pratense]
MISSTSTMQHLLLLLLILTTQHFIPSLSEKCNPHDKKALLQIKKELGNPTQLSSWNPTTDCCESDKWLGILCDIHIETYRVNSLELSDLDLPEPLPIPPSIFTNLPFLHDLTFNHIPNLVGPIPPSITNLTKLQYLYIMRTNISGEIPNTLSQIKTLIGIILYYNKLTGTLPDTLPSLPNLEEIAFIHNQLTGSIPESYGTFSNSFTGLSLSRNRLSGKIPASLAKLNLLYVDLSRNALEGDASVFFGSKKRTEYIILGNNSFAFDLGKVRLPKNLKRLDLRNNKIYGTLPKELMKLKHLSKLNVSNNNLCGEIPVGGKLQKFDESCYAHNRCLCGFPLRPCKT